MGVFMGVVMQGWGAEVAQSSARRPFMSLCVWRLASAAGDVPGRLVLVRVVVVIGAGACACAALALGRTISHDGRQWTRQLIVQAARRLWLQCLVSRELLGESGRWSSSHAFRRRRHAQARRLPQSEPAARAPAPLSTSRPCLHSPFTIHPTRRIHLLHSTLSSHRLQLTQHSHLRRLTT